MRRYQVPFNGKQFIGNTNSNQVHDLDQEDTNENGCQIDEIEHDHVQTFSPDTLEEAHRKKFEDCDKCLEWTAAQASYSLCRDIDSSCEAIDWEISLYFTILSCNSDFATKLA
jgi:hypothetical protein